LSRHLVDYVPPKSIIYADNRENEEYVQNCSQW